MISYQVIPFTYSGDAMTLLKGGINIQGFERALKEVGIKYFKILSVSINPFTDEGTIWLQREAEG